MKIASAAWPLEWHEDTAAYAAKLERWVKDAAAQGADLLVFPEYAGMEAACTGPKPQGATPADWLIRTDAANPGNATLHAQLARRHGVHILAGSAPHRTAKGFVNRAHLYTPDGRTAHQDKQILTPWERTETALKPGDPPASIDTTLGRLAILICYDSEFPLLAHALAGDVLLVPSCTDALTGASRIRIAAMARALEGRRPVVTSATLGAVAECVFLDANTGRAGHYAPADVGFSDEGVLAESQLNAPGWVFTTLSPSPDTSGEVDVPGHWPEQEAAAKTVTLRPLSLVQT